MVHDLRLLVWLRWRHAWARADYWASLAGADLSSASVGERIYLFYLALLFGGWSLVMMAAASNGAATVGADIGQSAWGALAPMALVFPSLLLGAFGARALRSSPVKLTFSDIAYVGASALDTRAVVLSSCLREVIPASLAAVPLGFLAGSLAVGMGSAQTAPAATAAVSAALVSASFLLAWAAGLARLRTDHREWHPLAWLAAPMLALVFALLPPAFHWPGAALLLALQGGAVAGHVIVLILAVGISLWLVVFAAGRMDMIAVIEESALYAQLQVFRPLRLYDSAAYADIVRRKRLASRRPKGHLLGGSGVFAFVARALVSHARQPRSLAFPVIWGAAILPYIAAQVIHPPGLIGFFPAVFLFTAGPSRQLLHVFQQDIDRPSLRQILPLGNLRLLLIDSLPALTIIAVTSAVAMGVFDLSAKTRVLAWLLCLLLGTVAVLCGGFERLRMPRLRAPIGYGISAPLSVCIVLYAGAAGSLAVACVVAAAVLAILGLMVRTSRE